MAVAMSWIVVSSIWNTTRITVEPGRLVVRHGPIAIVPSRELACRDIDELYCKQIELAGNQGPPQSFALVARLRNDAEVILMAHLREPEPCMYAAEQISAYLERTSKDHGRG